MGGGGSTTTNQSGASAATLPSWLKPLYQNTASELESAQGTLPSISSLYNNAPLLGTPALNTGQTAAITGLENTTGNLNAPQTSAVNTLNEFQPTTSGVAPATTAAEQQFNQLTLPQIQNSAAAAGAGNSGAALEAEALGQSSALTPLLEAQNTNALNAAGQQAGIGSTEFNQQVTALTNALQAAGVPYSVAQQQAQNFYNQQQQQSQIAQNVQIGPSQQFGGLFGTNSTGTSTTTQNESKF